MSRLIQKNLDIALGFIIGAAVFGVMITAFFMIVMQPLNDQYIREYVQDIDQQHTVNNYTRYKGSIADMDTEVER